MKKKLTVLIIDDDKTDRILVADSLKEFSSENHDFFFFQANNYDVALNLIRSERIDCIFLDYLLVGGDNGLDLLRELDRTKINIPVVFMTGHPSDNLKKEALEIGAKFFISKSEIHTDKPIQHLKEAIKFFPFSLFGNSSYKQFFNRFILKSEKAYS